MNRLAQSKSPYLLQHAHNPVDWREWNEETLAEARAQDKPIFLSIGYSTCHWCHVMERESFESQAVADLMNQNFINIKLDREERPDLDRVYMLFVQATNQGQGGWPMSVFLTPDLKPFFGGTYFPPRDSYGRPGFSTLLRSIASSWKSSREKIFEAAANAGEFLTRIAQDEPPEGGEPKWEEVFSLALAQFASQYDDNFGGFGDAPKFPRPVTHDFLHRVFAATGAQDAVKMSRLTLEAMSHGGMRDHLGGGFHRYSVDEKWIVSHYEKMLYDQAQLVIALLEMGQISGDGFFFQTARSTLDYILRDLSHPEGGFYSAEDADSYAQEGDDHKREGAFYVWSRTQIEQVLGASAPLFCAYYNVRHEGNAPRTGDPHGEFRGLNILFEARPLAQVAGEFGMSEQDALQVLEAGRARLFDVREARPRPHRDEKVIVSWNGLAISAFARAGAILDEPMYLQAAERAASFIKRELFDEGSGTLKRHYKDGASPVLAFADDYAALSRAMLDLFEATGHVEHLEWAQVLENTLTRDFYDAERGAYFSSAPDPHVLVRLKDDYDGAEPAASSLAAHNDLRLSELGDVASGERVDKTLGAFADRLAQVPSAMPEMLAAALARHTAPQHIVLVGDEGAQDLQVLARAAREKFLPFASVVLLTPQNRDRLSALMPWLSAMSKVNGHAAAYVCRDFACLAPVTSAQELRDTLAR